MTLAATHAATAGKSPTRGHSRKRVPALHTTGSSEDFPGFCHWGVNYRCELPIDVVFESGLGYCRAHSEAVKANREWLRQFFARWQEQRAAQNAAHEKR